MSFTIDRIDYEILANLQNDARLSNKELAAAVGLAPSTCLGRVQRLRNDGILGGAHAEVNPEAFGIGIQALIAVQLQKHSRSSVKSFWKHVMAQPEVLAVYHVTVFGLPSPVYKFAFLRSARLLMGFFENNCTQPALPQWMRWYFFVSRR